jgi:hypothetical protein
VRAGPEGRSRSRSPSSAAARPARRSAPAGRAAAGA